MPKFAEICQESRTNAGLTQKQAADKLFVSKSTIERMESNDHENNKDSRPGLVMNMMRVFNDPFLTFHYCKNVCPIGATYSFNVRDDLKDDFSTVVLEYIDGIEEIVKKLPELRKIAIDSTLREYEKKEILADIIMTGFIVEHSFETIKAIASTMGVKIIGLVNRYNKQLDTKV